LDRCLLLQGRTTFGTGSGSTYISSDFTPSCTPSSNAHAGVKVERKINGRFSKKGRQKSEGGSDGGFLVLTAETLSIMSKMPHEVCGKTACLIETEKLVDPNSTLNHDSLPSAYVHLLNLAEAIESSYSAVFVFGSDSLTITCKACDTNMSLSSRNTLWNIAQHVQSPTHNAAIKAREHIQKNSLLQFGFKIAVGSSSVPERNRLPSRDLICRGYYLSTCVYGGNRFDITCLQSRNQKSMEYGLCDELVLRKCNGDEKNYILHTGTLRFDASSSIYIHCCLH
jgi:hypothetical protein